LSTAVWPFESPVRPFAPSCGRSLLLTA